MCLFNYLGDSNNLGLILGLSFGFCFASLLAFIGVLLFYLRKTKRTYFDVDDGDNSNIPMRLASVKSDNDIFENTNVF
jgi:hypothetical protein